MVLFITIWTHSVKLGTVGIVRWIDIGIKRSWSFVQTCILWVPHLAWVYLSQVHWILVGTTSKVTVSLHFYLTRTFEDIPWKEGKPQSRGLGSGVCWFYAEWKRLSVDAPPATRVVKFPRPKVPLPWWIDTHRPLPANSNSYTNWQTYVTHCMSCDVMTLWCDITWRRDVTWHHMTLYDVTWWHMASYQTMKSFGVLKYMKMFFHLCDLDLWPMTLTFKLIQDVVMVHCHTKF